MTLQIHDWEHSVLSQAYEAVSVHRTEGRQNLNYEANLLQQAYDHCEDVTAINSRSFSLASRLLPPEKRQAVRALYAFCRTTDDIVDHPSGNTQEELCTWWQHSLSDRPPRSNLTAIAWADTRARYQIPQRYAEQLIEGVSMDLHKTRYNTFESLANYCYGVASTVGLMSMHIIGFSSDDAIRYAVKLGVALQLTNILRDVAEDWERGRLYLPLEELAAFNLTEDDIARGEVTPEWREFMKFQIARTRQLYAESWPGIGMLAPEGRLATLAAADFYRGILTNIEEHDYDVFSRRAHVTKWGKIRRLPTLWWQARQFDTTH